MRNTRLVAVLLCLTLVAFASVALAAGQANYHATYKGPDGRPVNGVRCGTHAPSLEEQARVVREVEQWMKGRDLPSMSSMAITTIPVAVHVIHYNNGSGGVSDG